MTLAGALALGGGYNALSEPGPLIDWFTVTVLSVSEFQPRIEWSGRVNAIAIHPTRPAEVFVTTESGGLFKSFNGGFFWEHVDSLPAFFTRDVAYAPGNPDVLIVTAFRDYAVVRQGGAVLPASNGGIWVSRDGGRSWARPATSIPRLFGSFSDLRKCPDNYSAFGISVDPSSTRIFVATDCGVSLSADEGQTWVHFEMPYRRNVDAHTQTIFPAVAALGDGQIIVGGEAGVFYSRDYGEHWAPEETGIGRVDYHDLHAIGDSPRAGEAFLVNSETTLFRTGDGGRTWHRGGFPPSGGGGCGGIAFVKAFPNPLDPIEGLDVYYGNRCSAYRRDLAQVRGSLPVEPSSGEPCGRTSPTMVAWRCFGVDSSRGRWDPGPGRWRSTLSRSPRSRVRESETRAATSSSPLRITTFGRPPTEAHPGLDAAAVKVSRSSSSAPSRSRKTRG
jgi:hypothetical protein